jgi:hypothetical protein
MEIARGLNIDVIELSGHALTDWFCKVASERTPGDAGNRRHVARSPTIVRALASAGSLPERSVCRCCCRADLSGRIRRSRFSRWVGEHRFIGGRSAAYASGPSIGQPACSLGNGVSARRGNRASPEHGRCRVSAYPRSSGPGRQPGFLCRRRSITGLDISRVEPPGDSVLQALFARSLIGSQDFPDLSTSASAEATLARFAEAGAPDARMWYLVEYRGRSAGCLLMAADWGCRSCELLYLGLAPEHRRNRRGACSAEVRPMDRHENWTYIYS